LEGGLVHEHPETVDGRGAGQAGGGQEWGFERVVHEVGDDLPRVQAGAVEGEGANASAVHTEWRGIDDDRGLAGTGIPVGPRGRGAAGACGRVGSGFGPASRNRDRGAVSGQGPGDDTCRTARAEHEGSRALQLVAGFLYRTDEAFAVSGVTVQMAVGQPRDRVDAVQRGRVSTQLVAAVGGGSFVRHRHRETDEIECAHRIERGRCLTRRHRERNVDPVETELGVRGVVEEGRQRMPDGIADDRREPRAARDHSSPAARAASTLRWCSSPVSANTWRPSASPTT
jgi:hypothetical protein